MNKNKPLISIIMPNYNNEKYLEEAILSVLEQTYSNFELIIIDDCSTDNSWKILKEFSKKDKRIKIFKNKKNLKIVKTLNRGLELAKGEYIARIDGDDKYLKNKLSIQMNYLLKNQTLAGVGTGLAYTDEKLNNLGNRFYPKKYSEIRKKLCLESPIAHGTILIKADILKNLKYSVDQDLAEDYDLWFRLLEKYEFENLKEITYLYRQHKNQGKYFNLRNTLKKVIKVKIKFFKKRKCVGIIPYLRLFFEICFLLIPEKLTLKLFYLIKFKKT